MLIQMCVCRPSSCSQKFSSRRSRQRQPHSDAAQQLSGPQRLRDGRRPDGGPVPVGPRQPESCCWGQYTALIQEVWSKLQNILELDQEGNTTLFLSKITLKFLLKRDDKNLGKNLSEGGTLSPWKCGKI